MRIFRISAEKGRGREKISRFLIDLLFYAAGCALYASAVAVFTEPNRLSPGGLTGVALILNRLWQLPTGLTVFILNVPLIAAGFKFFGGRFIAGTAAATAVLSVALDTVPLILKPYYTDGILAALFGGILSGAGLGLVLLRGSTTGGSDIAAKLINRRFPFVSIGRIILFIDFAVVMLSAAVYKNLQSALYSTVSLYAASTVTDGLLYGSSRGKVMHVITEKPDEISRRVTTEMARGVTRIRAVGGYTGNDKTLLYCAVRPPETARLLNIVKSVDTHAFVVISDAGEILGEGFRKSP